MSHADEPQAGTADARDAATRDALAPDARADDPPACPACGALARRAAARYCAICGRTLRERDYAPADALRASYRWQRIAPPQTRRAPARAVPLWRHRNEQTARGYVFLAYAFIPVVGVAFCACAFACCAAGLRRARLEGRARAAAQARRGLGYAALLAGAQTFIWLLAFYLPWRVLS